MNVVVACLVVVLVCVSLGLGHACLADQQTLICQEVPSTFRPSFLSLVMLLKDAGEINSTALHSDNLVSVTRLTINGANVTRIVPGAFNSFQNLQNLSLNQNALTQINSNWFGQPAVLKDLSIAKNYIEVLEEFMLSGLIGLTRLNLAGNRIRAIDPRSFSFQTSLVELDLSGNRMTRVTPQVFRSLSFTRIQLDGNPWDCSCGVEDFVDFLKDLQNRSLLEKEMEVTCRSPVSLSGEPVWNVSACVTQTPSRPPPKTETSIQPKPTDVPMVTVPTLIGVIVALCVLLCMVCFLAVWYRRKRGSKIVMPGPPREEKDILKEDSGPRRPNAPGHPENTDFIETIHWDPACRNSIFRAKSANAVLFTSPFCVAVKDHLTLQSNIEGPSEDSAEGIVLGKKTEEVGQSQTEDANLTNELIEKNVEHYTGIGKTPQQNTDKDALCVSVNTETVPYLSIGTDQYKPNTDLNKGQCLDSPSQRSPMIRVMGRVSTWPPTSAQWQARCNTKAREEGPGIFTICVPNAPLETEFENKTKECQSEIEVEVYKMEMLSDVESLKSGNQVGDTPGDTHIPDLVSASPTQDPITLQMNELLIQSRQPQSCPVTSETVVQENATATEGVCLNPNDETMESSSYHVTTNYPPVSEAQAQSQTDLNQDEELNHKHGEIMLQDPATVGQSTVSEVQTEIKNQIENHTQLSQNQDTKPNGTRGIAESSANQNTSKTNNKAELMNEQKPAQTKGDGHSSRQSGEERRTGSKAPSGGASPDDENLLCSNEYIDLLHEVVQNHGRWTRERWKQMHLNKQHYKQQGQGH